MSNPTNDKYVKALGESTCPVCGKLWYRRPENVYKLHRDQKLYHVCSWSCLCKARKGAEFIYITDEVQ